MSNTYLDLKPEKGSETTILSQNYLKPSPPKKVPRVSILTRRPELLNKACEMLGIDPKDMVMKTKEEVIDPKKTQEVNNLIYEHYIQRYQRKSAQVEAKAKELAQKERVEEDRRQNITDSRNWLSSSEDKVVSSRNNSMRGYVPDYVNQSRKYAKNSIIGRSPMYSPEVSFGGDDIDFAADDLAAEVINNYKKKLEKVQETWNEETKSFKNKPVHDPNELLNHALRSQVSRLNKGIEKAERYAQNIVDLNNRRKALNRELDERDNKIKEQKTKYEKGRSEVLKKRHESYEEKLKEIKEQKREFNIKLKKNAKKLEERFQELNERLNKAEEERQQHVRAKSIGFVSKLMKAKEQRQAEYEEIFQNNEKEKLRIERNVNTVKTERRLRGEESARAFMEVWESTREKRETLCTERKARTIGKLVQKSLSTEQLKEVLQSSLKKKSQETMEKYAKFKEQYREVAKHKKEWIKNVAEEYTQAQERVKEHREERVKVLDFKKEINNLRWKDQAENYTEIKRMQELRNVQIMEKERGNSLKLSLLKEQNQILSQARLDVDRRIKMRVERVITTALKDDDTGMETKRSQRPHTNRSVC